ncbi:MULTISPECIES: CapA family protein [Vitreoscilla]|uniref:CapA family protein n=1 Tax=Vitreoscilla stercoraria TaxID=61 RepID=A0ABY4EAA2_VITST|nr:MULTISPECIES: CapA family protein [Vitreoscilla]UOO92686.1 CapA family protein [Vitreoscilla stercoraria]
MTIDFKQINFYILLGIPAQTHSEQVANVIGQHAQAKLLPAPILEAAKHYLLSDMARRQYDFFLHHHPLAPEKINIARWDAYAKLNLSAAASRQDIAQALQAKWGELSLQEWLLVRKWLLNPRLRGHYDVHWQQHFSPESKIVVLSDTGRLPIQNAVINDVWQDKPFFPNRWLWFGLSTAVIAATLYMQPWQPQIPPIVLKHDFLPPFSSSSFHVVEKTQITITAVGDMTLGSHLGQDNTALLPHYWQQYGSSYFLENVADVLAHDDLSIANLEGPLTEANVPTPKQFAFKGKPALVQILEHGSIEAVNVANNHSHDYGQQGLDDTLATLKHSGIQAFGYEHYQIYEIKGKRIAMAGAKGWDVQEGKKSVDRALAFFKQEKIDYYIMSFHWGNEREYQQNATQQALGRYAIDQGFHAVLGHHPHVVQGVEQYKQGVIVYSLANFVFGGNRNPSDKDSLMVQLQLEFNGNQLVATEVLPLPLAVSDTNKTHNYQPVWADDVTQKRIVAKMQPYSNIDIDLGQRLEHVHQSKAEIPQMAQGQYWCDDSLSVRAALFGHSHERFAKCQPRQTPAHWG